MNVTQIYAIATGVIFSLCIIVHMALLFVWLLQPCNMFVVKFFLYPLMLWRHWFFKPWTWVQVFFHLLYLAVNIFCSTFQVSTVREVGNRAGTLSLINMMPFYFTYHLSFISDILGLFLLTYHCIHASTGVMSVFLGLVHAIINVVTTTNLNLFSASGQLFKFIVKLQLIWIEARLTHSFRLLSQPAF